MASTQSHQQVQSDIINNLKSRTIWQDPYVTQGVTCMRLYSKMVTHYGVSRKHKSLVYQEIQQALKTLVKTRLITC